MGKQTFALIALTAFLWLFSGPDYAISAAYAQADPTATPDADGVIYYVVRPGDSLSTIAFRHNVTVDTLLALNNMSDSDFIVVGDRLIVGLVTPAATPTERPVTPTPTRPPPTPTNTAVPPPPTLLCLTAFNDANGNGRRDPGELLQAGVAFTVFNSAAVVANYITDGQSEPHCLEIQTPGEYQVTRSVSPGETLTTSGNRTVIIEPQDVVQLQFGSFITGTAVPATTTPPASPIAPPDSSSPAGSETPTGAAAPGEPGAAQAGLIWLGVMIMAGLLLTALVTVILYRQRP